MEWELRALAHRAAEKKQAGQRDHGTQLGVFRLDESKIECAQGGPHDDDAQQESEVADTVGDKRLLGGVSRGIAVEPVAD